MSKNKIKKVKIFCFDIDNTICTTVGKSYFNAKPKKKIIKLINNLYENGHYIKLFTARYMGRNKENVSKAKKAGFKKTYTQLKKWNLKFHKLIMGKPTFDIYVDDRGFGFKKNWHTTFKKFIQK